MRARTAFAAAAMLLSWAGLAHADGTVVPKNRARVEIPDQSALIHFADGVETLAIETRFRGEGTEFAWVVPLPSVPKVARVTTGLFPTLREQFAPTVVDDVPPYWIAIVAFAAFLVVSVRRNPAEGLAVAAVGWALYAAVAAWPWTSRSHLGPPGPGSGPAGVRVHAREVVGAYDVATLSSPDADALAAWCRENGFVLPPGAEPVVRRYVAEGWVFVAARLRREAATGETTPHPLAFRFAAASPVYPLRLTGVGGGSLRVDLYVFGNERFDAQGFRVADCRRVWNWETLQRAAQGESEPERLWAGQLVHPEIRRLAGGATVATRLTGTLSSTEMREDARLEPRPFADVESRRYTTRAALHRGLSLGAVVVVLPWLGLMLFVAPSLDRRRWTVALGAGALVVGAFVAGVLPRADTLSFTWSDQRDAHHYVVVRWQDVVPEPRGLDDARRAAHDLWGRWPFPREEVVEVVEREGPIRLGRHPRPGVFDVLRAHEEDSPGNYTIREEGGTVLYVAYGPRGEESVTPLRRRSGERP